MAIIRPNQFTPPHILNPNRRALGLGRDYMSAPGVNQGEVPSGGGGAGNPGGVTPTILYDYFASGDFTAPNGPIPALNQSGFTWDLPNKTSIVTQDPELGNVVVSTDSNNVVNNGRDWTAKVGDNCLRVRYPAMPGGELSEQRFAIGQTIFSEIWMSFWIRVPFNFYHGGAEAERNHKIFRIWQDDYSIISEKFGMEFRGDGNGNSYFYIWPGSGNGSSADPSFVNLNTDLGRWMHLVVKGRIESTPGASDGSVVVWRKWEGELSYTKTHERLSMGLSRSTTLGKEGFTEGYLMGWHNGGYTEDTEWLIDDFKLSETSLLEE